MSKKLDELKNKLKPKKMKFAGLNISIENPAGSIRHWIGPDKKPGITVMKSPYGFINKTCGEDGEGIDCYLGTNPNAKEVYAINQNDPNTGKLDEQKVMLGFDSPEQAKSTYLAHYDRPDFYRSTTIIPLHSFKKMLTDAKPGSIKWKKKHKRDLKTQAIFSSKTENFDTDPNEHWITIGGKRTSDGNHVGGSHIEIKGDEIEKGPPALRNKPIDDLKSKMSSNKITPGAAIAGPPKQSSAPAPKITQYDKSTGKPVNSQPTSQHVEVKPMIPKTEHPFYDLKKNDIATTDRENEMKKQFPNWNKMPQVEREAALQSSSPQKQPEVDQASKNVVRNAKDLHKFGWGKLAQSGNANADKINELAAAKGITAKDAQAQLEARNNSPQLAQQNIPSKNASGVPGSSPVNQVEDNPTPSSVKPPASFNPPQEQLQPNIGAPKGPINDNKPTNKSPESSLFYPASKFLNQPSATSKPVGIPQQSQQELLSSTPESGVQRITPNDFAKGWDGVEGWAGMRDNPEHAENIARGLNQLGDREHAVMQHSNGKHIIVSRPKQNPNQLSQTPPEEINPNTQIPDEQMQEQLGETGAATPAINSPDDITNPNEIKQQENKSASQEPLFDKQKTPAQEPLPEQGQNTGKINDYSKASIERQLLDHFQKSGGNTEDQDERLTSAYHSPFTFRRTSKTKSGFPGEIDRMLEGPDGKKLRRLLSLTDNPESSQGADLMGDLGVDGYEQLLQRKLGGKKNAQIQSAIDFAKKSGDPQMEFLAKLHSITPDRQDKKPQEVINTQALQTGEAATIHGIPVQINEDENGNKSIDDGGHLPSVPLESMKQLPIDKGSLHNKGEPEVDESPFAPNEELDPSELEKEPDNVEAKQEIEQEPSKENAPVGPSQDNIGQEPNVESGVGEGNKEIPENGQGNSPDENVNPTTESPETNPSNQIGKSEGENRISESKPKPIPPVKSNKLEEKNEKEEKPKAIPQHSKTTNESNKNLGKEKQDVGSSDSKEKVNESPKDKPAPQSPVASNPPAKNEVKEENPKASAQIHPPYKHPLRDIYEKANPRSQQASKEANKSGNKVNIQESGIQARGSAMGLHGAKRREDAINNAIKQYGPTEKAMQVAVANSYRQPLSKQEKQYFKDYAESLAKSKNPSTSVETPKNTETAKSSTTSEAPEVDNTKQLGLYEKDKSGNPVEVGEKPGQTNLFNPNKYKGEEKPTEEKPKPQFDPKHTQEMFPNKEQSSPKSEHKPSPIDQLKDKMQKNKGSDYDVDENDGYVEVKRNGEIIASGVRQPDGKIGEIQYKHPIHQKLNAIRNAVQRAINAHQEK